jgi:hypothetical protein
MVQSAGRTAGVFPDVIDLAARRIGEARCAFPAAHPPKRSSAAESPPPGARARTPSRRLRCDDPYGLHVLGDQRGHVVPPNVAIGRQQFTAFRLLARAEPVSALAVGDTTSRSSVPPLAI